MGASAWALYKARSQNDHSDPLAEAQRLIREGRDREALLCLEDVVQRNPDSSEGWRLLGQLYAESDQDVEAIQCLRNLQFKENTVIDREGNQVDCDALYDTQAATASHGERNALEKLWQSCSFVHKRTYCKMRLRECRKK